MGLLTSMAFYCRGNKAQCRASTHLGCEGYPDEEEVQKQLEERGWSYRWQEDEALCPKHGGKKR